MPLQSKDVKTIATDLGAILCGIAPIDRFVDCPKGYHPTDVMPTCQSVIALAVPFSEQILHADMLTYTQERNRAAELVDTMAKRMVEHLRTHAVDATPVFALRPAGMDESSGRIRGQISLKHAGMLAGLGVIGKNTLLVNDKHGNMIWLSAVLTGAVLDADPLAAYETCPPNCGLCIGSCPVKALDEDPINQVLCWKHAFSYDTGAEQINCHLCRSICPNRLGIKS